MPPPISEVSRDSVSSNGSWIRRLSIRPLSQHGSPRSSIGFDSLSQNFSLGSAAPILSEQSAILPQQQARNKLVKRTTTQQEPPNSSLSRRGSRSQMPSLRRPATSHQRSATLQQTPNSDEMISQSLTARPKFSFDQRTRPSLAIFRLGPETDAQEALSINTLDEANYSKDKIQRDEQANTEQRGKENFQMKWSSYFHGRTAKPAAVSRGSSPFSNEGSPGGVNYSLPSRTIQVQTGRLSRVYITKVSALSALEQVHKAHTSSSASLSPVAAKSIPKSIEGDGEDSSAAAQGLNSSPQDTPSKRARRSISMNFSSPTTWISKTGSIRRPKRSSDHSQSTANNGIVSVENQLAGSSNPVTGKRHVSAPLPALRQASPRAQDHVQPRSATTPADLRLRKTRGGSPSQPVMSQVSEQVEAMEKHSPASHEHTGSFKARSQRQRNSSSPLPPLSRLSSFNVDLSRLGASSNPSAAIAAAVSSPALRENQSPITTGFSTLPRSFPLVPRNRDISDERSSTLASSDLELRGFVSSGDDDDTDFKSDTIFDSVRTAASARIRSTDTPIESMFDESPPSTAGNSKTKRLSIQEILGQAWDSDTRIMEEEDEEFSTPNRTVPNMPNRSLSPASVLHHFHGGFLPANNENDYVDAEVNGDFASTASDTDAEVDVANINGADFGRPSLEDDDDDWASIDESGVTNHLSPPSRTLHHVARGFSGNLYDSFHHDTAQEESNYPQRSALSSISGNGGAETFDQPGPGRERPRSNLFDWSESTVHMDKSDGDGHSPRPKTVHGKQELDVRSGRPANRKGAAVAHVRSQSVPVNADPSESSKPSTSKFGTWASGPKNVSEDWDDDFDFGTNCSGDVASDRFGGSDSDNDNASNQTSTVRAGKIGASSFAMIVPASIQATQPTVKAHSGQIRELSLLVDGLKRLCRHARDLNIIDESPSLWKEAENIIALASPDEDLAETTVNKTTKVPASDDDRDVPRTSIEFDVSVNGDHFQDDGFDDGTLHGLEADSFIASEARQLPSTPPPDMKRTAVIRERHTARRRSVFSPEDDIFGGGWPATDENSPANSNANSPPHQEREEQRPQTPAKLTSTAEAPDSAMIESIMLAMQQQRSSSAPIRKSPIKQASTSELFFNTNTLQELVKRANSLFHTLSDQVRGAELITQSPAVTPRHDRLNRREDGSPAFTRVFTDPSSPSKRLPKSNSGSSVAARASPALETSSTTRVSQRLQMMTVN